MPDLLDTPAARDWVNDAIPRHSKGIFGKLAPAVIWSDARGDDGEPLVPVDPIELVAQINSDPCILLHYHDPGRPKGQVLESANFESDDGGKFIAAVLGFYAGGEVLGFRGLGLDTKALAPPPERLPVLPDGIWIQFATDPREVDAEWLDQVTSDAPLRVERTELSHNAADSAQELIRVVLPYLVVIWNPFTTSIASEAGKGTYAAIHGWVQKLLANLADRRNPILDIHTHQDGCQVSFLFRGKDVGQHYAAHDALPNAAAQAAQLIAKLKAREMAGRKLIYEFDKEALIWFPSYAVLNDNRIITDNGELIAIEQLPTGLSLGLSRGKSLSPVVRAAVEDDDR
ncbi:hypothetical protein BBC27_08745 [Acidithiobacillus ferrivorans]|uniref:Uncharacterized protein n=1 Tax=Acidithiobacillus ferrivorans TaxID=160808 RepID=A0A1B9C046_9PROT|nr:hypothetical protein [Acidithiobacillus ferrivorans]OCB03283.1 hypothetical protein BBC27_08745 [Acidithiobacillus ferrivorans]